MGIISGVTDFFGLDIGTTAVRAVQLKGTGDIKALDTYGYIEVDPAILASDAKPDQVKLGKMISDMLKKTGIGTKNVAVNIPSNRVFTAVIDMNRMSPQELDQTMRYQADSLIPTPLADSKVDWVILGDSPQDLNKVEVLLSSVPNSFVVARMEMLEAIGLDVQAIEPDNMALARAVLPTDAPGPQMVLDGGNTTTDLLIAIKSVPRLSRALPIGGQSIVHSAQQALGVELSQAQQYVFKFGLSQDKLDGQVYNAILPAVEGLISEIEKSIKFFVGRYNNAKLERIVVTGGASAIPEFPLFIANNFGLNVEIGNAWRNVSYPSQQQNDLMSVSNHFAVASGLAQRSI